jgi:hypothetical protein
VTLAKIQHAAWYMTEFVLIKKNVSYLHITAGYENTHDENVHLTCCRNPTGRILNRFSKGDCGRPVLYFIAVT